MKVFSRFGAAVLQERELSWIGSVRTAHATLTFLRFGSIILPQRENPRDRLLGSAEPDRTKPQRGTPEESWYNTYNTSRIRNADSGSLGRIAPAENVQQKRYNRKGTMEKVQQERYNKSGTTGKVQREKYSRQRTTKQLHQKRSTKKGTTYKVQHKSYEP